MSGEGFDRRLKRLNANLQRGLEEVFARGLNDPRVRGMVSITSVEIAKDLKTAKIGVSIFPHEHESLTMHAIRDAAAHIRRRLMEQVEMRDMPRLTFELDEGLKKQAEVMGLLAKVREEREAREGAAPDDEETGA
ncbi:MAG: 30S ribosome-binding factor RbfA [Phycisphaerales bacterium]